MPFIYGGGGGGASGGVTRLGPYTLNFNDSGISDAGGVTIATIPVGALLLDVVVWATIAGVGTIPRLIVTTPNEGTRVTFSMSLFGDVSQDRATNDALASATNPPLAAIAAYAVNARMYDANDGSALSAGQAKVALIIV